MKYVKLASAVLTLALLGVADCAGPDIRSGGGAGFGGHPDGRAHSPVPDQAVQAVPQATPAQGSAPAQTKAAPTAPEKPSRGLGAAAIRGFVEYRGTCSRAPQRHFHNTTIMHSNNGERILLSPIMVAQVVSAWRKSMPDLQFTIEDAIIQGTKLFCGFPSPAHIRNRCFPIQRIRPVSRGPEKSTAPGFHLFGERRKDCRALESYNEPRMRATMGSSLVHAGRAKAVGAATSAGTGPSASAKRQTVAGKPSGALLTIPGGGPQPFPFGASPLVLVAMALKGLVPQFQ